MRPARLARERANSGLDIVLKTLMKCELRLCSRVDHRVLSTRHPDKYASNICCRRSCLALRARLFPQTTCYQCSFAFGTTILGRDFGTHCSNVCYLSSLCFGTFLTSHTFRETVHESDELPKESRDAAALLASKVYYYLGEYDEALSFALGAGPAFEAESRAQGSEEYVETVVCEC